MRMRSQDDAESRGMAAGQPAQTRSTDPRRPDDSFETRPTLLRPSVFVKGEVTGSEDMMLDGTVEGRIDLPDHTLTVGPNAMIRADITARVVTIFGTVIGSITARDTIDVRLSGFVKGNMVCRRLAVQSGANLSGRVETRELPSAAADVPESKALRMRLLPVPPTP